MNSDTKNACQKIAWVVLRGDDQVPTVLVAPKSEHLSRLRPRASEVVELTSPRSFEEAGTWLAAAAAHLVTVTTKLHEARETVFERDMLIRKLSAINTDKAVLAELGIFKSTVVEALRAAGFEYPMWIEHYDERAGKVVRDPITTKFSMMLALEEHPAERAAEATKAAYDASLALMESALANGVSMAEAIEQLKELHRVGTMSPLERSGLLTEAGKAAFASRRAAS